MSGASILMAQPCPGSAVTSNVANESCAEDVVTGIAHYMCVTRPF